MDPDQTAHTEAVWSGSGSTLFVEKASNISADDKSIQLFCDMRFKTPLHQP